MKKFLKSKVALAAAFLVLTTTLMSACGGQTNSASGSATAGGEQGEQTTLTVWGFGEEGTLLSQMSEGFEKENPDIKLDIQVIPWDVADEKLTAAIAGKTGPDVIQMQTYTLMNYASAGALLPLDDYVEKYPELALDNFFDFGKDLVMYEGQQIGVPWYVDATVLFYRTDIFEEMNLEAPTTWDELKSVAQALTARGEGNYGLGIAPANPVPGYAFVLQSGGDFVVDGKAAANSKEFSDAMAFYQSFFEEGLAPLNSDVDLMQEFIDGSIPMTLQEPWVLNVLSEHPELDGKWATTTLPSNKNNMSYIGGCALVASQFTKNADAAARFIAYMSRPENQVQWHEISKTLPSAKESWNSEVLTENEALTAFGEQLNSGKTAPMVPNFMAMIAEFGAAMEKVTVGGQDPVQVCEELNQSIDKILNG